MIPDDRRVGLVIKVARMSAGLTQQELGERCGLTRNILASLENGRKSVHVPVLITIAQQLQIPVERLLVRMCSDEPLV